MIDNVQRGRGRPPGSTKDPSKKRTNKLVISLTEDEMRKLIVRAAKAGFRKVTDWARAELLIEQDLLATLDK